jgi:hypothetical protein
MEEMERNLRLEALWGVTTLAMYDPEFRSEAIRDLESALWMHGFALSPPEMERVKEFREKVAGMSDEELVEELRQQPDIVPQRGRWC